MKYSLLFVPLLLSFSSLQAQQLNGEWINELGSVLVIDSIHADGSIHGVYKSSSGVDGRIFNLTGSVNRGESQVMAIAFSVTWDGYSSITSWTGFYDTDDVGAYIKTLWHLVRPDEIEPWERIITNSSTFRPLLKD